MNALSTFLYARPSLAEGAARILDFGDTLANYNSALTGEQADYVALWADWRLVGYDIETALKQYAQESSGRDTRGRLTQEKRQEGRPA